MVMMVVVVVMVMTTTDDDDDDGVLCCVVLWSVRSAVGPLAPALFGSACMFVPDDDCHGNGNDHKE